MAMAERWDVKSGIAAERSIFQEMQNLEWLERFERTTGIDTQEFERLIRRRLTNLTQQLQEQS